MSAEQTNHRMTTREKRERRAERLRGWSAGNEQKADGRHAEVDRIAGMIPMGQPILVGHHSERGHRRDIARIENGMRTAIDLSNKAERQAETADEIERQAAISIYDDDPDAIERLQEKLARLEAEREQMKTANAAFRKTHREQLKGLSAYQRGQAVPFPSYSITNLGGNITRTRDRLARLQREREQGPRDRIILARFDSACELCGAELKRGGQIRYNRQQGARCMSCDA